MNIKIRTLAIVAALMMLLTACDISISINNGETAGASAVETTGSTAETTSIIENNTVTAPQDETTAAQEETTASQDETTAAQEETTAPQGSADASAASISLSQAGSFANNGTYYIFDGSPVHIRRDGAEYTERCYYTDLGVATMTDWYVEDEYFGNGMTAAYLVGQEHPVCGLVNVNTGETLLQATAAKIEQLTDRYYYVIYTTEKTDNEDECFIYFTDSLFSLTPSEGDTLFKGYATIFDAQEKKLLDSINITKPGGDVIVCGTSICVQTDWSDYDVYGADGTLLGSVSNASVGSSFILVSNGSQNAVYDPTLKQIGTLGDVELIDGDTEYVEYCDADYNSGVMDMDGNVILEAEYDYISEIVGSYVVAQKDDKMGIVKLDGTEVCAFIYEYVYVNEDGISFRMTTEDDQVYIFVPGYQPIDVTDTDGYGLDHYVRPDENDYSLREYIMVGSGSKLSVHNATSVCDGLICADEGLIETITGTVLLDNSYDKIGYANGYVYALKNNTWYVFAVEYTVG